MTTSKAIGIIGSQKNEPLNELALAVTSVANCLKNDYPSQFSKLFGDIEDEKSFKNRLYAGLKGVGVEFIINGYEDLVANNPKFMPTGAEIKSIAIELSKNNKRSIEELKRVNDAALLPKPTIKCNPVKMYKEAIEKNENYDKSDKKEWLKRKELARLENLKIVGSIGRVYADDNHLCNYDGCKKAGSMSSSTTGSDRWYCKSHFAHI